MVIVNNSNTSDNELSIKGYQVFRKKSHKVVYHCT